ncbi:MAG: lipoprotein-releasing system permease protein [bacterium]|nr:MAG: lipoprotein-releasing system permease protein [bacterium]
MRYEIFIALRYLRAKRRQAVLSFITFISAIGIMVGVWALVIVLAFQSGMEQDLQNKILGGTAHINLLREDEGAFSNPSELVARLEQIPSIKAAAATLYTGVYLNGAADSRGAIVKSVDLEARKEANEVFQTIVQGSVDKLRASEDGEEGIILGTDLATDLGVKLNDTITIISSEGRLTPGGLAPRQKVFTVVGLFKSGLYDYDSNWSYISLEAMKVVDIYKVKEIATQVLAAVGPGYKTKDWQQLNQPVFAALNLQRLGFLVGIGLIILVAALNIITTLTMMVVEKNRDIAILMSMGATRRSILYIFVLQGLIIGIVGMTLGTISGVLTSVFANKYQLIQLDPRIYSISYVPFNTRLLDVLLVATIAVAISFIATIYPAWKASQLVPVEGLRYE